MFCSEIDSKKFLQLFVDNYIKTLILLRKIFKINISSIIIKYIEKPKEFSIEKYNCCKQFINDYNKQLDLSYSTNYSYYFLNKLKKEIGLYFGGENKYNELINIYWNDIHKPLIIQGLIELNKFHPIIFPKKHPYLYIYNMAYSYVFEYPPINYYTEFQIIRYIQYRLTYIEYNKWTLIAENSYINIQHNAGKIFCDKVNIEEILAYLLSLL